MRWFPAVINATFTRCWQEWEQDKHHWLPRWVLTRYSRYGRYCKCEIFLIFATQSYKSRLTWTDVSHPAAHNEGLNDEPCEWTEGIACTLTPCLLTTTFWSRVDLHQVKLWWRFKWDGNVFIKLVWRWVSVQALPSVHSMTYRCKPCTFMMCM